MIDLKLTLFSAIAFISIGVLLSLMILYARARLVGSSECRLLINEDESLTKEAQAGTTLLFSLLSNGIQVPSPCGGKATCKQCKVQVVEGAGPLLETDKGSFSKKELDEGWRLSCQCKVKNDIQLKIPTDLLDVKEYEGKVISNENVATFIKELVVELPEAIDYRSGAYLQFHVPEYHTNTLDWKTTIDAKFIPEWEKYGLMSKNVDYSPAEDVMRAYSMASYPAEGKIFKFNIRIASPPFDPKTKMVSNKPWGICSSYLFSLKEGDTVKLSGPYGESYMKEGDQEIVFLIGGAGSSFGRAHIMHLFKTENTKRKVTIWYGARSLKENIYQEDFENLEKEFDNFKYHLVLSEPEEEDFKGGWPKEDILKTGFVFRAFEEGQLKKMEEPDECLYYVCGPPLHNQAVMHLLDRYGVPRENIVLDDFGS